MAQHLLDALDPARPFFRDMPRHHILPHRWDSVLQEDERRYEPFSRWKRNLSGVAAEPEAVAFLHTVGGCGRCWDIQSHPPLRELL